MHKTITKYLIVLSIMLSLGKEIKAQDIHYTQYSFLPILQNAANTGFFEGNLRFSTIYRNQWATVPVNYNSLGFSFDANFLENFKTGSKAGVGLNFYFDQAGDSKFQTLHLMLPIAYHFFVPLNNNIFKFSLGIEGGFQYKSLSTADLYYDSQFNGEVYNENASTNENFSNLSVINPDLGVGLKFEFETKNDLKIGIGFAMKHLNDVKEAYLESNLKPKLRKRFVVPIHFFIPISNFWDVDISYLFNFQNKSQEHLIGTLFAYTLAKKGVYDRKIKLGMFYRLLDAPAVVFQYETNSFIAGISYDINASKFSRATNTYGGLELGFTYLIKNVIKPNMKFNKKCFIF